MTQLLDPVAEEEFVKNQTMSTLSRRLLNWSIEVEAPPPHSGNGNDQYGLQRQLPMAVKIACNMHKTRNSNPYHYHNDASGPHEFVLPYTNHEHILKDRFDAVVLPNIFKWDPDGISPNGSCHIHISVVGDFQTSHGYYCGPMVYVTVTWNTLVNLMPMIIPFFLHGNGRKRLFPGGTRYAWAYPTIRQLTPKDVRKAYQENIYFYKDYQTKQLNSKPPTKHAHPYMALQWNRGNHKAMTMELRVNEQHPYLTFGVMSCLSSLIKTRCVLTNSISFDGGEDLSILMWNRIIAKWKQRHRCDTGYRAIDVDMPIKLSEKSVKLRYNSRKLYRKREWDSPLQFFKELCLFSKYEKIYNRKRGNYNKVDAGLIMLLFANGLIPKLVPSYLLWDIKRLYHYVFFEGKSGWCYKNGLLTDDEIEKHCPLLTEDPRDETTPVLISVDDDPFWGEI